MIPYNKAQLEYTYKEVLTDSENYIHKFIVDSYAKVLDYKKNTTTP